jgi:hypothetical protein
MFNTRPQAPWVPFTIPPCPTPVGGKQYALSFSGNAVPTKNPSQFLEWQEVDANLLNGINKGDLLYWDPAAGDEGAWIVLAAPQNPETRILKIKDGELSWTDSEFKQIYVCENGSPKQYWFFASEEDPNL